MTVQFGVHIGPQKATMAELRRLWTWLDGAGTDWISVWDHLYEAPAEGGTQPHFEAIALLGAMAADTTRARLGCLVFCAPYRNVGLFAKSITTIDHISGGRFEVGMGSGWYEAEAHAYGLQFPSQKERFDILEEQLDVLRAWFSGQRVTRHTSHHALDDASLLPQPIGRMPIWVGGVGRKRTLRMAGAIADGWNAAYIGAGEFRELNGVLDDWCTAAGREPGAVERSINLMFSLSNEDPASASARLDEQWGDNADRVRQGALMGRPEDVMDRMAPYVESGAQLINVVIRPPWDQELLASYVDDIVPQMRKEWAR
jgi:alkanesulfonate monooxygenase SsuD/methylene tetrahydromethanopterin reductase-like flavin-dependent oxidoreductase (luciferase family)